ncbi:MAG: hypothetical protein ACOCVR_03880 [Myxococcota bacterium]
MKGTLRATLVCLAIFAVVAGAAWSGGASRRERPARLAQPSSLFGGLIPLPEGAWAVSPVGDSIDVSGIPMRVAHFLVESTPSEVMAFYLEAFQEAGLDVDGTAMREDGGALVAWDHEKGIQRTVTIFAQGSHSMVFPAITSLQPSTEEEPLPPGPSGARLVSDVVARDGGSRSRTISMQTPLSEDTAATDLLERLRRMGYRLESDESTVSGRLIEVLDPRGRRLVYTLSGGPERMTAVSVISEEM